MSVVSPERLAQIKRWDEEHPEQKAAAIKRWRQRNPEKVAEHRRRYERANREKRSAQYAIYKALKRGTLTKAAACEACDSTGRLEAHHDDYTRKLEVRWLCPKCHAQTKPNTKEKTQ